MIFFIILFTMALTELTKPTSLYKLSALWYDKIFIDVEGITLLNVGVPRFKASIVCTFIKLLLDFSIHTLLKKESFYKCESFFFFFFLNTYDYYLEWFLKMLIINFVRKIIGTENWNEIKQLFQKCVGAPGSFILGAQSKPLLKPCSDKSGYSFLSEYQMCKTSAKGQGTQNSLITLLSHLRIWAVPSHLQFLAQNCYGWGNRQQINQRVIQTGWQKKNIQREKQILKKIESSLHFNH